MSKVLFMKIGEDFSIGTDQGQIDWCHDGVHGYKTEFTIKTLRWDDQIFVPIRSRNDKKTSTTQGGVLIEISADEEQEIIAKECEATKQTKKKKQLERIKEIKESLFRMGDPNKLPDFDTARRMEENFNNIHNEGGSGYVPHFACREEYDGLTYELTSLESGT